MTGTVTTEQATTTTASWLRLARGAAITMVVWSVVLQATAGQVIPPVLIVGLVFVGFAPFLTGERRRLGLAYAVVAALALLGNAPFIIDELLHIDSAPSFVLTLLSVAAALVAVTSGLGAFFGWTARPITVIAIGATAVWVAGSVVSIAIAIGVESDTAASGDVVISAEKVSFQPGDVSASAGTVGVLVENRDGIRHTFTIDELDVNLDIPAGKAKRLTFDAAPGTYTFHCRVPGHEAMTGTLTVEG